MFLKMCLLQILVKFVVPGSESAKNNRNEKGPSLLKIFLSKNDLTNLNLLQGIGEPPMIQTLQLVQGHRYTAELDLYTS